LTLSAVPSDDAEPVHTTTPEQLGALAHPMRNRLLFVLGDGAATVSQLTNRLRTNKGNVAHHLAVLERVGLVRVSHTRQVRGGTERYFTRTVTRLRSTPEHRNDEHTAALLQAVADEITASPTDALLHLRRVRLTRVAAVALAQHLDDLVSGLPEASPDEPTYGVLVGLFRSRS
jgi:predicted ArsR family transcriptional regulator